MRVGWKVQRCEDLGLQSHDASDRAGFKASSGPSSEDGAALKIGQGEILFSVPAINGADNGKKRRVAGYIKQCAVAVQPAEGGVGQGKETDLTDIGFHEASSDDRRKEPCQRDDVVDREAGHHVVMGGASAADADGVRIELTESFACHRIGEALAPGWRRW